MLTVLEKVSFLQEAFIFKLVPTESLARVATIAQEMNYEPRQFLYRENSPADAMIFMLEGGIVLLHHGQEKEKLGACEMAGALAVLAEASHGESAMASQPSRALLIDRQDLHDAMAEDFEITRGVARALARLAAGGV
jgi:CRP-like cAMP-binding protein